MAPADTDRDRNDQGRFADGIDPETVLDVFDAREDRAEPITASDVVDELGIARRTAHNKLNRLVDRDTLATRKIGARGRVWWIPIPREDPDALDTDDLRGDPETTLDDHGAECGQESPVTPSAAPATRSGSTPTDGQEDAEDPVDTLDLPGSGGKLDARRDAIRRMYDTLRDHASDPVDKDVLLALVDPDAVGYTSDGSFWTNCVKANASAGREHALVALPGVEDWGGGEYRYTPPEDADP